MDQMNTCCEATDGAQCCREENWGGWCEKPPLATVSARNPRKITRAIAITRMVLETTSYPWL